MADPRRTGVGTRLRGLSAVSVRARGLDHVRAVRPEHALPLLRLQGPRPQVLGHGQGLPSLSLSLSLSPVFCMSRRTVSLGTVPAAALPSGTPRGNLVPPLRRSFAALVRAYGSDQVAGDRNDGRFRRDGVARSIHPRLGTDRPAGKSSPDQSHYSWRILFFFFLITGQFALEEAREEQLEQAWEEAAVDSLPPTSDTQPELPTRRTVERSLLQSFPGNFFCR